MTGKLNGICGYSTNPLTNGFCNKMSKNKNNICYYCYSRRMLKTFRSLCNECFNKYNSLWSRVLSKKDIQPPNSKYVRINPHGELINEIHLNNVLNFCKWYPNNIVSLYTKRLDLINKIRKKPENLIIVYSNPIIDTILSEIPPGVDKIFNVLSNNNPIINCKGKSCINCLNCYRKTGNKIIVEMLK